MVIKLGLVVDVFVGNALVGMYGKCGVVDEVMKVFDFMPEMNLVSWNSMICAFSENEFSRESFDLLMEMLGEEGLLPNVVTVVTILPVCAREGEVDIGMGVHGLAMKLGSLVNGLIFSLVTAISLAMNGLICRLVTVISLAMNGLISLTEAEPVNYFSLVFFLNPKMQKKALPFLIPRRLVLFSRESVIISQCHKEMRNPTSIKKKDCIY
ncbi:hypothetical protein DKX38_001988 [Salix brachista]|uniref:Uncharacterized protein n=1 Tax=Salix brachista TaxID=2182728 RepID=A0A5N5NKS8_9ROSI|nr:hypothetical protein DKX38_001988 [Salix brachista]